MGSVLLFGFSCFVIGVFTTSWALTDIERNYYELFGWFLFALTFLFFAMGER